MGTKKNTKQQPSTGWKSHLRSITRKRVLIVVLIMAIAGGSGGYYVGQSSARSPWTCRYSVLKRGSANHRCVRFLQLTIGAPIVNGVFGPKTYNALRAYQGRWGLKKDGIAGPQTWNRICQGYYRNAECAR